LQLESLETRRVLTAWHNDALGSDVDNSGIIAPRDVVLIVNELAERVYSDSRTGTLPADRPEGAFFLDVRNDGFVAARDALLVINDLGSNVFNISENAANGTLVGRIEPSTAVTPDSIFELVKDSDLPANIRSVLELKPDDHYQGAADAPVLLIEYLDFACPTCGLYHPLFKQALDQFDGQIAIVSRHLPLTQIHPNARLAAIAAEAAGRQGKFDEMADLLFTRRTQTGWDMSADPRLIFQSFASQLGLNISQFNSDLADPALDARVTRDVEDAFTELGLGGTPSLIVNDALIQNPGPTQANVNQVFQAAIDAVQLPFNIDRVTGDIRLRDNTLLDFETESTIRFDVMVNGRVESVEINLSDAPG
jgi:protein-disulfide isomerase